MSSSNGEDGPGLLTLASSFSVSVSLAEDSEGVEVHDREMWLRGT